MDYQDMRIFPFNSNPDIYFQSIEVDIGQEFLSVFTHIVRCQGDLRSSGSGVPFPCKST